MLIDKNQAYNLIKDLSNYYKDVDDIARVDFPSCLKCGSEKWVIYMFYSCLLDYGMRSTLYHQNLVNTYINNPDIFNPSLVIKYDKDKLLTIMKDNIHPRYPNMALKKWLKLSCELSKYNSVKKELTNLKDIYTVENFIKNLGCYGQKTGNFLIRILFENDIFAFPEINNIPIDRHDIEISYLNNVISKNKLNANEISELSNIYIQSGKLLGIKANMVDKYLWEIGNTFCRKKDCFNCPLNNRCRKKV